LQTYDHDRSFHVLLPSDYLLLLKWLLLKNTKGVDKKSIIYISEVYE